MQQEQLNHLREAEKDFSTTEMSNKDSEESLDEEVVSPEPIEEDPPDEGCPQVIDWNDLTKEQWTEKDLLLQKVQRVGPRISQLDYLSSIGNIVI